MPGSLLVQAPQPNLRQREIGPWAGRVKGAGPIETDARAAIVRLDARGRVVAASAAGGIRLDYQGTRAAPRAPAAAP
jgi:hypothetical protein